MKWYFLILTHTQQYVYVFWAISTSKYKSERKYNISRYNGGTYKYYMQIDRYYYEYICYFSCLSLMLNVKRYEYVRLVISLFQIRCNLVNKKYITRQFLASKISRNIIFLAQNLSLGSFNEFIDNLATF